MTTILLFIKRKFQELAILLELVWIFFPGILFILLSLFVFTQLLQGKDVIALALESAYRGFFLLITYSLPLRRTILQSALRFLIDALTFIFICFNSEL